LPFRDNQAISVQPSYPEAVFPILRVQQIGVTAGDFPHNRSLAIRIGGLDDVPPPDQRIKMSRSLSKLRLTSLPRRGLSREEAAMYLGISSSTFDEMRATGQVEPPRLIKGRKLFDIRDLDMAFDALPREHDIVSGTLWHDD
jgi:hypothetical protein